MKVIAIKAAFFNGARVRVNDELDIPEKTKGSWFLPVDSAAGKSAKAKPADKGPGTPKTLSEAANAGSQSFNVAHAGKDDKGGAGLA